MKIRKRSRGRKRRRSSQARQYGVPLKLFATLVVSIFLVEGGITYFLQLDLLPLPRRMHILIDPLLLLLGIFPLLYFVSFRPMLQNLKKIRRTDRKLKRKNILLEEILNGIEEGIGIVDVNENVVFCNAAYAGIFEETTESLKGKNLREYIDDESFSKVLHETDKRRKGKISTYEIPVVTSKGNHKHIQAIVSPRFGRDGTYKGAFGAILDITERKQMEDALKASEGSNHD